MALERTTAPLPVLAADALLAPSARPTYGPDLALWWVRRLLSSLALRYTDQHRWDDYYEGRQPLAFASDKFREAFGGRFEAFCSNFCALVVDAKRERLEVVGFAFDNVQGDADLWRIWQANDLDMHSQVAHTEVLVKGLAYTLVQPTRDGEPIITVEDSLDTVVEHSATNGRVRLAGLKRWVDDDGHLRVNLYWPDLIVKYRTKSPVPSWPVSTWVAPIMEALEPYDDGLGWPERNPLGVVPLVPLPWRPRLGRAYQSEIAPIMSNQDAINKYRADALVASEFAAFRQRWATGIDIPIDPETGRQVEPFKAAVDRLWVVPPPNPEDPVQAPEAKFGEFGATPLAPYLEAIRSEVGHMSSISAVPYYYLLGEPQQNPPSGESLRAADAPLARKVRTGSIPLGVGWEETMRVALLAKGDARAGSLTARTIFTDPETVSEAVRADAVLKLYLGGIIDDELAAETLGWYTPEQLQRLRDRRAAQALRVQALAAAQPQGANPGAAQSLPAGPRDTT